MTFISIPITGHDINEARLHVHLIATKNHDVNLSPFSIDNWSLGHSWEWYMARTLTLLEKCDTVFFCQGWQESKGCSLEHEYALYLNKKIIYENS